MPGLSRPSSHPSPPPSFRLRPQRRSCLRGGVWVPLAPRKGRDFALPTSQGGSRRERVACPGFPCLAQTASGNNPAFLPSFPFLNLFHLFLFVFVLSFCDRVSNCSSDCSETHLVDEASNSQRSACLCLLGSGMKGVHYHVPLCLDGKIKILLHFI